MRISSLILVLLTLCLASASAQISFVPMIGGVPVEEDRNYLLSGNDSCQVHLLKGYISNVQLVHRGKIIAEPRSFHLIDFLDATPVVFNVPAMNYDSVYFTIGIDSAVQVKGVMEGALDPSNGMYWTWQSGYIHFKLEGTSAVCSSGDHQFQYHIGGYRYPNNTCRVVSLPYSSGMKVGIDLQKLLKEILPVSADIMSPGTAAAQFATQFQHCFYRIQP